MPWVEAHKEGLEFLMKFRTSGNGLTERSTLPSAACPDVPACSSDLSFATHVQH